MKASSESATSRSDGPISFSLAWLSCLPAHAVHACRPVRTIAMHQAAADHDLHRAAAC